MIFRLLYALYPLKISTIIGRIRKRFYSEWIKYAFHSCGKKCDFWGFSSLCGARYIDLGNNLYVGNDVVWEVYDEFRGRHFTPSLSFGDGSSFGDGGHISCVNRIAIGNGVRIGRKVFITDNGHGSFSREQLDTPANLRPLVSKGPVIIEDNVWIGEMSCILPGVTIGRGAIVGANSVVTHDVPPYTMVAGSPARIIKEID
jgi:acetyltransferase-like isoleucine patch superfamily enzyme